ncbi:phage tail protein [Pigmentiphaga sp. CHJ604]|uniref:phage tail-collar fiber domain-containing protein n=1 Tax=Pigmentiphaga sp. CHJ604 TaxID=3081984 RepID=UPI0030D130D4
MAYKTISTTYGLQRQAAAATSGSPITLTEISIGDGNGNDVTLDRGQVNIIGERLRRPVSRIYQLPDNPSVYVVECTIPAEEPAFVIRTAGMHDEHGGMVGVCNTPVMYKPNVSEGAIADFVFSMLYQATNDSVVSLFVDPNVAVASRTWALNTITAALLLPGGTTGQVARKRSNADGDIEWADPTDVNVVSNTIEENQTLAASQTTVNLNLTTVQGLALYVDGERLRNDEWTPDPVLPSRLSLGAAYPAGSKLTAVQNEPAGALTDPLAKAQNLADVPDKALARANLDVYSKAEVNSRGRQPGDIFYTARSTAPARSLKANGAAVSRTVYADLFAAIGTRYGAGDGFNTFNLPDLRGEFIRGLDDGRGIDIGRVLGTLQLARTKEHFHGFGRFLSITGGDAGDDAYFTRRSWAGSGETLTGQRITGDSQNTQTMAIAGGAAGDLGTSIQIDIGGDIYPRNVAQLACIAY